MKIRNTSTYRDIRWTFSQFLLLHILHRYNLSSKKEEILSQLIFTFHLLLHISPFLQVRWDEPDMLQNVKRVSPWLVEMVSNIPAIHPSPYSPPRKKFRLPHHPVFPLDDQFPMPSFTGNPLGPSGPLRSLSKDINAGIQGTRHAQIRAPISDHLNNKLQLGLLPPSFPRLDLHAKIADGIVRSHDGNEDISCLLSMGNSSQKSNKADTVLTPRFILFGQPILTEQQMSRDCSSDVSEVLSGKNSLSLPKSLSSTKQGFHAAELGLGTGHCKVFLESDDVGRILQLSALVSYEELYKMLGNMFEIERLEMLSHVFYHDVTGAVKQVGEEPFR